MDLAIEACEKQHEQLKRTPGDSKITGLCAVMFSEGLRQRRFTLANLIRDSVAAQATAVLS
ncbi:hypothetical protein ABL850_32060 [Variovorax paradoxus]|uniref:hypothetical protein n=1 Tax=Variovorax paradoxus TaxID=34073 RepID=UPI00037733E8|nr:hypothetical protein [Variovorax paradoxus]